MILRTPGNPLNIFEARRELRRSLVRELPAHRGVQTHYNKPGTYVFDDETTCTLLAATEIHFDNAVATARKRYTARRSLNEPTWDQLFTRGWVRELGRRVWLTPTGLRELAAGQMPALAQLHETRFHETYTVRAPVRRLTRLGAFIKALESGDATLHAVGCQTPSWVAARVWETVAPGATQRDLYQWLKKWEALAYPDVTPVKHLPEEPATRFIDLALETIATQLPADGWQQLREDVIAARPGLEPHLARVPADPPRRLQWAERYQVFDNFLSPDGDTLGLVRILVGQIELADIVAVPYDVANRLFALALDRPAVLQRIADLCGAFPVVLADLALNPATCALACSIIARYTYARSMATFGTIDDTSGRERAFADAVTVLTFLFETDQASSDDVAALFVWLFRERGPQFADRRLQLYRRLRQIIDGQSVEHIQALIAALIASDDGFSLETAAYVSALGVVADTAVAHVIDVQPFLEGYVNAIQRADYSLSVQYIAEDTAAVVVQIARTDPAGSLILGQPAELFALREPPDPNPFTEEARLARAIRTHVRVLCRALSRLEDGDRHVAVTALARAIAYGARGKEHGGVISAFSARYEDRLQSDGDRPITDDLALALRSTGDSERSQLLEAIRQIDEPYTLAVLHRLVVPELRQTLAERITQLGPDDAAISLSYRDTELRIEALLSAGLTEVAQAYTDAERDIKTLGVLRHRERVRFVNELRLTVLHKEWQKIYEAQVPETVDPFERQLATESLAFYKGVAQLLDPEGSPEAAEQTFLQLSWKYPQVPAYANNLLVARARRLFGTDVFAILSEDKREEARTALADAGRALTTLSATDADRDAIDAYRGAIFLGLNAAAEAFALVGPRILSTESAPLAAVVGVAQHRLGDSVAASQTLEAATKRLGNANILDAARAVVGNQPHVAVALKPEESDDQSRSIRDVIYRFRERDPEEQARILGKDLPDLLIEVVRDAAVLLQQHVPSLREDRIENDYNTTLRKFLEAFGRSFGWSVSEESPGGRTADGTVARRDIVIKSGIPTFAVVEGLVVDRPITTEWTKGNLRQHFAKVVSYETCRVFFVVTYADINDPSGIIPLLRDAAREDAPDDYQYVVPRDLPESGSRPPGFFVEYTNRARTIYVVFVILDVRLRQLIDAAAAGVARDPRNTAKRKAAAKKTRAKKMPSKKKAPAKKTTAAAKKQPAAKKKGRAKKKSRGLRST
jgi:hypothetical protein